MESFMDTEFTFDEGIPVSAIFGDEYMEAKLYLNCSSEVCILITIF